jgi:hypothetical protein
LGEPLNQLLQMVVNQNVSRNVSFNSLHPKPCLLAWVAQKSAFILG